MGSKTIDTQLEALCKGKRDRTSKYQSKKDHVTTKAFCGQAARCLLSAPLYAQ